MKSRAYLSRGRTRSGFEVEGVLESRAYLSRLARLKSRAYLKRFWKYLKSSLRSRAGRIILAFFKSPAAQHAKAVKRSNLDNRVGFGLRSLLGWPTPPLQGDTCSPPLIGQLLSLPSEPLLPARLAISSEGQVFFSNKKRGRIIIFLVSCSLKLNSRG